MTLNLYFIFRIPIHTFININQFLNSKKNYFKLPARDWRQCCKTVILAGEFDQVEADIRVFFLLVCVDLNLNFVACIAMFVTKKAGAAAC